MKSKLLSLFLALIASAGTMFADGTKIGDLYYNLNATDRTAEVTYKEQWGKYNYSGLTTANIPASVTYSGTTYSVIRIGKGAFYNCRSLTSVTIPNSVTSIGSSAFYGCSGLTSLSVEAGNTVYDSRNNCNAIIETSTNTLIIGCQNTTIPNSVTSIGHDAFRQCSGLTSVTIPNSVTSIGEYAFCDCWSLTSVTIPNSVTSIGYNAFSGCRSLTSVTIPNSVTSIGEGAFSSCISLTSVTIPNSVTSIESSAFSSCSSLTSVTIPNSVTSIGSDAFFGCSSLTSVTIPNSVTSIGNNAFQGCSGLTSVTIPNSVTSIGISAFYGCSSLTSVTIPNSITSIGVEAFYYCTGLTSVTIPNSVTSIGWEAFYGCSSLTSVTIPNSVTSIGVGAFRKCSGLTSVTIPNSVTSIGGHAFQDCSGLTSVTIPNSVTSIGGEAFYNCRSLTAIYVPCGEMARFKQMLNNDSRIIDHVPLPYTITINAINGTVAYPQTTCDDMQLTATPYNGYHFVKWSDGNTDNPRAIELTQDTTFTAEFAKNTYTISTTSANPEWGATAGGKSALYQDEVEISATPNYGYHFVQWSDYNTEPTRTIVVERDSVITATFAKNVYSITKNAEHGTISGNSSAEYLDYVTLTATPDYGYHFTQWSDGNTDNPRTFVLIKDTTFTAQFALNQYTLSLQCDENQGSVEGAGVFDYLAEVQISATPAYGYHFSSWSDGNTANPRTVSITEDKSYTATFAKNTYTITKIANNEQGSIFGPAHGEYLDNITLIVTPEYGYHFTQWSDGNTDTPRTFELTCDTTFTALFALNQYTLSLQCDGNQGTVEGAGLFDYLAQVQISATPAYGYHFSSWSDGNTSNPRTVSITEDKSYTATFAKNTYTITKIANNEQGSVSGPAHGEYLDNITLTVTPEYGYHFTQWSDGNTDNPRTFELTCDTTFTALFALNQYTLSLQCDENQGSVEGAGVFDYLAEVQISATPAYGYHFSSWSDGNTDNPRTYTVIKDVTITANFAPNKYSINVSCNAEQGSVTGSGSYNYLSNRTIEATSNYGYHFKQWSDGNTDNPRTIELRQDTTLEAIFAVDKYGTCGDNLQLTWRYDTGNQTLTISGEGDLTTNMRYGVEAVKEMRELVIEDGVGVIGNEAFANIKTLNTITLGKDVRKLQERVFYNCYNLTAIYNYRKTPASATSNTFEEVDKYACTIYVLAGSEEMFRSATGWKDFYSILTIGATETTVTDNKATVEPSDNSATVTWPVSNEAASYTIDITKDGVVFCRLTFNANGQLTGIAFAPGRDGQSMAPAAVMTANGLQFTVTGLSSNTQYGYSITATDAENTEVASYTGTFTTTGEIATAIDAQQSDIAPRKFIRDNQVLILRDGKTYSIQGVEVR